MRHPRTAALICVLALLTGGAHAQDRSDAERRLQGVRTELRQVAAERRKLEGARGDASRKLREADEQVGGVQLSLQKTQATLQRDGADLQRLQAERARYTDDLDMKKAELARLLRAAQFAGSEAPLKTMLAQDRVAEAERALTYQGYLQRGQVQRIRVLSAELQRIDGLEREIVERRDALARERRKQANQLLALQQARKQRAGLLAGIDQQYQDRAGREKALGRDAKALQDLLARLRAAAAKAARDAARAKAEAERQAAASGKPKPKSTARRTAVASAPAMRVGGLGWPVAGNLLASFGGKLPDGRRSDGVLIAAAAGTAVKAVADGTVVYADWMTGYGNILIIDHGNGYMSLYAHNDGLLRDAGDAVKRGDSVASVGTSGGQEVPALYFELRRNGAPVNPASWLTRQ
ncbi:murein hydrolase activator EnvC family protein [Thermomonas carbonis]|uniref:Peptidoglycan DD-metalloendopeptidase family protein n=1 Tax=Thermomonas carbonis TaxID=1463158 RepID=A0A7G9SSD2_9GAMM|nr:peptidoglycan DD-metalloendopeptidase family protein [Thermomonas carbonis]QNN70757.1 peptidoglycan DD-metalloendopeptidase family protein [Thermomonas carbonis]GHC02121.1 peptidase M23 [Thermomonas carbonis]